jgi:hypothetical protein
MGDISKGVANTLCPQKKYTEKNVENNHMRRNKTLKIFVCPNQLTRLPDRGVKMRAVMKMVPRVENDDI